MKKFRLINILDEPEIVEPDIVYVVGQPTFKWVALLLCPCGCESVIHLNLLEKVTPRWSVKKRRNGVEIRPSINRYAGCRSHFVLSKGRIRWVYSTFE